MLQKKIHDNMKSLQISNTKRNTIKSEVAVKYSSVLQPSNFAHLQCCTDLNLPQSDWSSSTAKSYGLQHMFFNSNSLLK